MSLTSVERPGAPTHYVAVGASAGGLEAIESLFANMPADAGLGFIVVQHLSPDYKSLMVELLSKRTRMPVHRAEENMLVEADHIYLIPPKKNLSIFHGRLLLSDQDHTRGINLPIDVFLKSLAEDQGEKAVAVILSGTGSDGMRGVRVVKEHGGMVMVQDEASARFDGMPKAAASTGLVDFVLPPDGMAQQLLAYAKHPYAVKSERAETLLKDEDGLSRLFSILRDRCKVDFTYYKPSTITRRIERRMAINQVETIEEYVPLLLAHPGEAHALYRELLIGVTSFFRDHAAFEALEQKWLPALLQSSGGREVRCWVAGCSTGEEAYSIAITMQECLAALGISRDVRIFATDIDQEAIHYAANGLYPESIAADLPQRVLAKYFQKREDKFQIARSIREMVVFAPHNLTKDPPFTNISLISCRNLLIYLQPVLQKRVLEYFSFSLNGGGILLLGSSESASEMSDCFEAADQRWRIYRSRGRVRSVAEPAHSLGASMTRPRELAGRAAQFRRSLNQPEEGRMAERLMEAIVPEFFSMAVVVNQQLEVLHIIGDPQGLLGLPSGKLVNSIEKMASKDLSIPLSTGIRKAFRQGETIRFTNVRLRSGGGSRWVDLCVKPLAEAAGRERLAAVIVEEAKKAEAPGEGVEGAAYDLSREAEERIREIEQELQLSRENLQATIEELETANEELQATNEELLASNEELQSTNEELQSTNEELYTVNAEYQGKILELTELHNDVENLLSATQTGQLILDENLEIRRYSPRVTQIFALTASDIGRPIGSIQHYLADGHPLEVIREVAGGGRLVEAEVRTREQRWYLMRVVPYVVGPKAFAGTVVSFVDITRVKDTQRALGEQEALLDEAARLAKIGSWQYLLRTGELRWSEETFRIHELEVGRQPDLEGMAGYYASEHQAVFRQALERVLQEGTAYDLNLELETARGHRRWVRTIGHPVAEEGKITKISGAVQDLTELAEAAERTREAERLAQGIVESLHERVCVLEAGGEILFANRAWREHIAGFAGQPEGAPAGANFLQICDASAEDGHTAARRMAEGLRAVMEGRAEAFEMEYAGRGEKSSRRYLVRAAPFEGAAEMTRRVPRRVPRRVVVTHELLSAGEESKGTHG